MKLRTNRKDFGTLEEILRRFEAKGRSSSAAFVIWFLRTIYRMDDVESEDAVCDATDDGGIDGLIVDDDLKEIVLFQGKRREKLPATLGDTDLKKFTGSMTVFRDPGSIRALESRTHNTDLRRLLNSNDVAGKVQSGYQLRGIFIANVAGDQNCQAYISASLKAGTPLDLWDLPRLSPVISQLRREWFIAKPITILTAKGKLFWEGPKPHPILIYAAVPVKELINMPGIPDTRLFAQNVRLSLGRTRVNKEIVQTIKTRKEHSRFLTFHNGLTIVANELRLRGRSIRMNHYSVCNGCQSLLAFYENRNSLTDNLEILVRFVRVNGDRSLSEIIAYRTNNQNPISLRDLRSNADTQVQLKAEFDALFSPDTTYMIKRGETSAGIELSNELAGQLMLALYVGEPWNAHQKYRIFGEDEKRIFRYGVSAYHIRWAQLMSQTIEQALNGIAYERIRKYSLTGFILIYFVGEMVKYSADGKQFLSDPSAYLKTLKTSNPKEDEIIRQVKDLTHLAVTELNFYIKEHGEEAYDYKSEFKSPKAVQAINNEILKAFEKDIYTKRANPFMLPV
jgi:hypothetical protein